MLYEKHIFICTNERLGNERKSCGEEQGLKLIAALKKGISNQKIPLNIRVQKCGCLDTCENGPSIVVYPDGVFYGNVKLKDINRIIEEHILNNSPVQDIRIY